MIIKLRVAEKRYRLDTSRAPDPEEYAAMTDAELADEILHRAAAMYPIPHTKWSRGRLPNLLAVMANRGLATPTMGFDLAL